MLRIFVASVALVAITIVLLLHTTHHGARANSPTHCGRDRGKAIVSVSPSRLPWAAAVFRCPLLGVEQT